MQILIADDDAISRRLAMHALAGCGADVAVAEDGHAAWTQIQDRTQSTVLILDRMMREPRIQHGVDYQASTNYRRHEQSAGDKTVQSTTDGTACTSTCC